MTSPETNARPQPLTSTKPYQSAQLLATFLFISLLLNAGVYLLAIVTSLAQFGMLNAAVEMGAFTEKQATVMLLRYGLVASLSGLVYLPTVVLFCLWIYRVYSNLAALGNPESHLEYSPGWAVGGFFIPVMNLYLPYRATAEIWRKSDPAIRTQDDFMFAAPGGTAFILVWWLSWIVSLVLARIHTRLFENAATPDQTLMVAKLEILAWVVALVAAVFAALVVKAVTTRQDERSKHVVYTPNLPPPPPLFNQPPHAASHAPGRTADAGARRQVV